MPATSPQTTSWPSSASAAPSRKCSSSSSRGASRWENVEMGSGQGVAGQTDEGLGEAGHAPPPPPCSALRQACLLLACPPLCCPAPSLPNVHMLSRLPALPCPALPCPAGALHVAAAAPGHNRHILHDRLQAPKPPAAGRATHTQAACSMTHARAPTQRGRAGHSLPLRGQAAQDTLGSRPPAHRQLPAPGCTWA